jgi:hypothetical protein
MADRADAPHRRLPATGTAFTTKPAEEPINVWDYRYVKDYPSFSTVKTTRSGNPTRYLELDGSL